MPALVIRDLAPWLAEHDGQLVAGAGGAALDRAVEGVARPRRFLQRDLDVIDAHDLVIVSIDSFTPDTDFTLAALIAILAETQAGILVAGLPPRDAALDDAPYRTADALALPLFAVPFATDLAALTGALNDVVQVRQVAMERRIRAAQGVIARARHTDASLTGVLAALAEATGLACIVEDEHRVVLTLALPSATAYTTAQVHAALASYAARRAIRPATPGGLGEDIPVQRHLPDGLACAIVPVLVNAVPIAHLALLGADAALTTADVEVLWRVAPLLVAEIQQVQAQLATPRRTAARDLAALLSGALAVPEMQRIAQDHINLAAPFVLALAQANADDERWAVACAERLAQTTPPLWATPWQGSVALLLPAAQGNDAALAGVGATAIGISRPARDFAAVPGMLREAADALRVAHVLPSPTVRHFADLGVLRLILPFYAADGTTVTDFCRDTLAPFMDGDGRDDTLLATLEAYFAANSNLTEAARRLGLHRNTLMYRLHRIEELIGGSLEDADRRLALHLALVIRRWQA
jgi:purine catabolism regulator